MERDGMTFRQYLAAIGVALFSPISRLLPRGVLRIAGFSGWLSPLAALPFLLLEVCMVKRLVTVEGETLGLGEALERRLGRGPGKAVTALLTLWIVFYGGVMLRAGGERLLSTIYPSAHLGFFLPAILGLSVVFALGKLRTAGRCALVLMLFFTVVLALSCAVALPSLRWDYVWPPDFSRAGDIALGALPVMDVLSPWALLSFLRGRVSRDENCRNRAWRCMLFLAGLTVLLLLATIGDLGPALALRQQYPFFVMVKNLRLFDLLERFDAMVVGIWVITDYVLLGMLLLSSSAALQSLSGSRHRQVWVPPCAGGMLLAAFLVARNAFSFAAFSERIVPGVNLALVFVLLPVLSLIPPGKKLEKTEK